MARELAKRSAAAVATRSGDALKKAAKKAPGKKAAKKVPGKKGAKHPGASSGKFKDLSPGAFHHLQRAAAVISLLEGESGGDLRMLLEEGVTRYRAGAPTALGMLRAAEHLAMAGLYAARASYRLDVTPPAGEAVGKMLDRAGVRVDRLLDSQFAGLAAELLRRAEGAEEDDQHLAWELGMAADGLAEALETE